LTLEKEYLAQLKVYTSTNLEGIDEKFINFFVALVVDQAREDHIILIEFTQAEYVLTSPIWKSPKLS
jgi:hypothetical protein